MAYSRAEQNAHKPAQKQPTGEFYGPGGDPSGSGKGQAQQKPKEPEARVNPPGGGGGGGGSSQTTPKPAPKIEKNDPGKDFLKNLGSSPILKYPNDLFEDTTDYLKIEVFEYEPSLSVNFSEGSPKNKLKTFYSYMPGNISTTYSQRWGEATLSPNGRYLLNAAGMAIRGGAAAKGSVGKYLQGALKGSESTFAAAQIAKGVSQFAPGTQGLDAQSILGLSQGLGINSTVEVFWGGHGGHRTMSYTITMAPRNEKETTDIKDIVTMFKVGLHPGSNGASAGNGVSSRFVTYPYMFKIAYMSGSKENEFLNKFKECVLESLSVNYTPNGGYSTLQNGSPVATVLTLNFKEIRHIYREDVIDTTSGGGAGY